MQPLRVKNHGRLLHSACENDWSHTDNLHSCENEGFHKDHLHSCENEGFHSDNLHSCENEGFHTDHLHSCEITDRDQQGFYLTSVVLNMKLYK